MRRKKLKKKEGKDPRVGKRQREKGCKGEGDHTTEQWQWHGGRGRGREMYEDARTKKDGEGNETWKKRGS
jgi:hypothetical protein